MGCAGSQNVVENQAQLKRLGSAPLCEASAIIEDPWEHNQLLVADNEIKDRLFSFLFNDGELHSQVDIPLPDQNEVRDIEALAHINNQLIVIGSHSRNGQCKTKKKRQRIQVLTFGQDATMLETAQNIDISDRWKDITADLESCIEGLFVDPPPPLAHEVCEAIVTAETEAGHGQCLVLDIEGATAVFDTENENERLWLGLRRPRVDDLAVMLRMTSGLDELRFDAVVFPKAKRGIRAMTTHNGYLWVVFGPRAPDYQTSCLWRTPIADLVPGEVITGEAVRDDLPPSSEGLAFIDDQIIIVTDGDEPEIDDGECETPAHYFVLSSDMVES